MQRRVPLYFISIVVAITGFLFTFTCTDVPDTISSLGKITGDLVIQNNDSTFSTDDSIHIRISVTYREKIDSIYIDLGNDSIISKSVSELSNSATVEIAYLYDVPGTYSLELSIRTKQTGMRQDLSTITLVIGAVPARIITEPQPLSTSVGQSATFSVQAAGTRPLKFQWYHNDSAIANATSGILGFAVTEPGNSGSYQVIVANDYGRDTSRPAILTLLPQQTAPIILTQPESVTTLLGDSARFLVTAHGYPAIAYQWFRNDTAIDGAVDFSFGIQSVQHTDSGKYFVSISNTLGTVNSDTVELTVATQSIAPQFILQPLSETVSVGDSVLFQSQASGVPAPTYQWYKDSVAISGAIARNYVIPSALLSDAGLYYVNATNTAGNMYSNSAILIVKETVLPPIIVTQPISVSVQEGDSTSLSVVASGSGTLRFQWYKDSEEISGANGNTLTINPVTVEDSGSYKVSVSNFAGSVTSSEAHLSVLSNTFAPLIQQQPLPQVVLKGTSATFEVTVIANPLPSFQWRRNGDPIQDAVSSVYVLSAVEETDAGLYDVLVTNSLGTVTSDTARLTVTIQNVAPVITQQPVPDTVLVGDMIKLSCGVTGVPTPQVQWYHNSTKISGADSTVLMIPAAAFSDSGMYAVEIWNILDTLTSSPVVVRVFQKPVIVTLTSDTLGIATLPMIFTAVANGVPAPGYQWLKNGAAIETALSSSYTIEEVTLADSGLYAVRVTNAAGTVTSNAFVFSVNSAPEITAQPASKTFLQGSNSDIIFSVRATGKPVPTYQWKKGSAIIPGATSPDYVDGEIDLADGGDYSVLVMNTVDTVESSVATLTVHNGPLIQTQPESTALPEGAYTGTIFSVVASGTPAPTYQWMKNGAVLTGQTSSTFTLATIAKTDTGHYSVDVMNVYDTVTSNIVTLTVKCAPIIKTHPASTQTVTAGETANFSVVAEGVPAPTYQWLRNDTAISGATSSTYAIVNTTKNNAATYKVRVTNEIGSQTSNAAVLNVLYGPEITAQPNPLSVTIEEGQNVTMSVTAIANPSPTYKWKRNGVYTGSTGRQLTLTAVTRSSAGSFSVMVSNSVDSVESQAVSLDVRYAPSVNTGGEVQAATVDLGQSVTFRVSVAGNPQPDFQWQRNGVDIASAQDSVLTMSQTVVKDSGLYTVRISNSIGSITSSARLTIRYPSIAARNNQSFIVKGSGELLAFGNNISGQLGLGSSGNTVNTPQTVTTGVRKVVAGFSHTLILKTDGTLVGVGSDGYGELSQDNSTTSQPTYVTLTTGVKDMAAGSQYTMVIKNNGDLYACGFNYNGQLGNGSMRYPQSYDTLFYITDNVNKVTCGEDFTMVLKNSGDVYVCGNNSNSQHGYSTSPHGDLVLITSGAIDIAAGDRHSLILKSDSTLWVCGSNEYSELCIAAIAPGGNDDVTQLTQTISHVKTIVGGNQFSMVVLNNDSLYACGKNFDGEIGDGSTTHRAFKFITSDVYQIAAGDKHAMIIKTNGKIYATGSNLLGQLGDGGLVANSTAYKEISY